ncbi:MAG: GAF domain-containing protein [Actinomycetota bacterium]|nr:GAF domain-containing protein [Actinomycetota bacterium]
MAEASELLSASLEWEETLAGIARLAIPSLADWCIVDVLAEDRETIRQVAVAAADPHKEEVLLEMRRRYPPTLQSPQPAAQALRTSQPAYFREFTPESLRATTRDADHFRLIQELDPSSAIAVPLVAGGETVGAVTFAWAESRRTYGEADVALAQEVSRRAALAIENARLYAAESQARAKAETAQQRFAFLAEASDLLSASLDYDQTLTQLAELAVPRIADWCIVYMREGDGSIRRLAIKHFGGREEAVREVLERHPLDPDARTGVPEVMRTGQPELRSDSSSRQLAADVTDPEALDAALGQLDIISSMCVPLSARGRTLGAIEFVSAESDRRFDEDDLALAKELADRAALAVDNASLYHVSREAARASAETAALLDTLVATAPIGIAFLDRDFRFIRINDALASINGPTPEEHLGRTVREVIPELAPRLEEWWNQVLASGEPLLDLEFSGKTPAAGEAPLHLLGSYYPVESPDGAIVGIGAVVVDITERKRADEARRFMSEASTVLSSSLDWEKTLARVANLAVPALADWCTIDMVGDHGEILRLAVAHADPAKVAWANELEERYPPDPDAPYGVPNVVRTSKSELFSEIPDQLLVEATEGDEGLLEILRELGLKSSMCVPLVARERVLGAITFVSEAAGRRFDEADLALAEDLARRAAIAVDNARLFHEAEQRAEAARVLEYVGDGVFMLDRQGVVRFWNRAAETITGLEGSNVVGRALRKILPSWEAIVENIPVLTAPGSGASRAETVPLELPDRERWLSISGVGFQDGIVYAFRDLTEERALEELRSEFVSTVSHELRTPLAAIYGAALTLRRTDLKLGDDQRDNLLAVVANEADRLARTVNDILWASRLDSSTLQIAIESCSPVALAETVVAAAKTHAPPDVEIELEAEDELPEVASDPDKVRQVLANLIDNAVKYSPDGGRVALRIEPTDRTVRFSVVDQGLGIPSSEQRRIFDKFYRLDPDMTRGVGGTGLGLYICRELIRRMNGRIWVDSREGRGSTFAFELPASDHV